MRNIQFTILAAGFASGVCFANSCNLLIHSFSANASICKNDATQLQGKKAATSAPQAK